VEKNTLIDVGGTFIKILQPYYYRDFKCIAGKCRDSCCIGWRVPIDKNSFIKYEQVKGKFANTLNINIKKMMKYQMILIMEK